MLFLTLLIHKVLFIYSLLNRKENSLLSVAESVSWQQERNKLYKTASKLENCLGAFVCFKSPAVIVEVIFQTVLNITFTSAETKNYTEQLRCNRN